MPQHFTVGGQLCVILALAVLLLALPAWSMTAYSAENSGEAMPLALTAAASFEGGDGTKDDPYKIATAAQLKKLADDVNGGNAYSGKYFELTEPIDLGGSEDNQWTPIGPNSSSKPFSGIFDGGGNKVSGL